MTEDEERARRRGQSLMQGALDAALALVEFAQGDIEFARNLWNHAFEEAERIDHNESLGEPYDPDREETELMHRFDEALARRGKFHTTHDS